MHEKINMAQHMPVCTNSAFIAIQCPQSSLHQPVRGAPTYYFNGISFASHEQVTATLLSDYLPTRFLGGGNRGRLWLASGSAGESAHGHKLFGGGGVDAHYRVQLLLGHPQLYRHRKALSINTDPPLCADSPSVHCLILL